MNLIAGFPPTHDSLKAKVARTACPGYSYCFRCGMPWKLVREHVTAYADNKGGFPLCESCWATLGHPEARIPYYAMLLEHWACSLPVDPDVRSRIGAAVAAGL